MASVHFRDVSNRELINNARELVRSATTQHPSILSGSEGSVKFA